MSMEKIKIERNSVQETLIAPLFGRKMCSEKFPDLYNDNLAKTLCDKLDYDFSNQELKKDSFMYEFGALEVAMRQLDIMWEIKEYLKKYPEAMIVNLGCGLDQSTKTCDNGKCKIVNIDFPDVIDIRNQLIPPIDREINIAGNLLDYAWIDKIDDSKGIILFAAGVFHYFKKEDVKNLIITLSKKINNGCLVFDTVGKCGLKLMLSKTLKNMGMDKVDGFFYVNNPDKDLNWSKEIKISYKGYMLGYYNLKDYKIHFLHRMLSWIGDNIINMKIIKMEFKI